MPNSDGIHNVGFSQWTEKAHLEIQCMEKLGEFRLNLAKERSIDADTGLKYLTAQARALGITEATQQLARMRRERQLLEKQAEAYATMGHRLSYFRQGDSVGDRLRNDMWIAWTQLLRKVPSNVIEQWGLVYVDLDPADLVWRTLAGASASQEMLDWGNMTFTQAMRQLHLHWARCVVVLGSPLYQTIDRCLNLASSCWTDDISKLKQVITGLETKTYERVPVMDLIRLTEGNMR